MEFGDGSGSVFHCARVCLVHFRGTKVEATAAPVPLPYQEENRADGTVIRRARQAT